MSAVKFKQTLKKFAENLTLRWLVAIGLAILAPGFLQGSSLKAVPIKGSSLSCPEWKADLSNLLGWRLRGPALECRSTCVHDQDCVILRGACGRVLIVNKKFQQDVALFSQGSSKDDCRSQMSLLGAEPPTCRRGFCELQTITCEQAKKVQREYLEKNFRRDCRRDQDCSFLEITGSNCLEKFSVNNQSGVEAHQLNLTYIQDRILQSCGSLPKLSCEKSKLNQCFTGTCIRVEKRIERVNFLSLEGAEAKPNQGSRTLPPVAADFNELSCSENNQCQTVLGVCGQSLLSVNKRNADKLRAKILFLEGNLACPSLNFKKSQGMSQTRCIEGLCLFE